MDGESPLPTYSFTVHTTLLKPLWPPWSAFLPSLAYRWYTFPSSMKRALATLLATRPTSAPK
uniref:Uncharacterized protein n=1 Tax=Arundo donax TaxID=35708 RepID=A0A0A9FS95_ARUDO